MKRFLIFILVVCLLLVPFSGCEKSKNLPDETTVSTTAPQEESTQTEVPSNPASDFEYEINDENEIIITNYIGQSQTVVIPKEINGKTVTKINNMCFSLNDHIQSVSIPNCVIEIGGGAFFHCTNLNYLILSDQIEVIGGGAFEATAITEIILPKSLRSIGMRAFADCKNLKHVNIPKGLTTLDTEIFCGSGLETVTFEEGVEEIASAMFASTNIKEIITPQSMKIIHQSAFVNCANLEKITLNKGLVTIGTYAFGGTSKITEIVIPESVTNLKDDAFSSCETLEAVKFEGDAPNEYFSELIDVPEYTIYYHIDAIGFTHPEWNGYPTEIW